MSWFVGFEDAGVLGNLVGNSVLNIVGITVGEIELGKRVGTIDEGGSEICDGLLLNGRLVGLSVGNIGN